MDTHCHIQFRGYDEDREQVIKRCEEKGVIMNAVGTQKDTSRSSVELAQKHSSIYATVGLHPIHLFSTHVDEDESKFLSREETFDYEYYKNLAQNKKVIAIGECGLDLYRIPEGKSRHEILEKQKKTLVAQHDLARELDLPLVIHVRDAHDELLDLLKSLSSNIRGVIHCYTSNWQNARQYLNLGLHLGFTGVITFPPKKTDPQAQEDLLEVVEKCPLDKMLVETDSPYLAPQAYRGKKCEPWMVEEVVKKIAKIKSLSIVDITEKCSENARNLFRKII